MIAFSVEEECVGLSMSRHFFCEEVTGAAYHADREVDDLSAGSANEMVMLIRCKVEMLWAVTTGELNDLTQLNEKVEVSVNGA